MNTAKHTPGPWDRRWSNSSDGSSTTESGRIVGPGGHGTIAHLVMDDAVDANARLIAAAPDLLAALQHLMRYDFGDSVGAQEARAAIQKAIGTAK